MVKQTCTLRRMIKCEIVDSHTLPCIYTPLGTILIYILAARLQVTQQQKQDDIATYKSSRRTTAFEFTMPEREDDVVQVNDDEPQVADTKPKQRKRRRKRMLTGISKQRRLANERERKRLQVVNTAFVSLKNVLPLKSVDQKISRIEIVRLASRHIASLMQALHHSDDLQDDEERDDFCCDDQITTSDEEAVLNLAESDDGSDSLAL